MCQGKYNFMQKDSESGTENAEPVNLNMTNDEN